MALLPIFAELTGKLRQCVEIIDSANYHWVPTSAGSFVASTLVYAERSAALSDHAEDVLDAINHLAELCHRSRMYFEDGDRLVDNARCMANQRIDSLEHLLKNIAPSQRAKTLGIA